MSPVEKKFCTQGLRSLPLTVQLSNARHREINVQLHGDIVFGPRRSRQVIDLLESELAGAVGVHQHEPIRVVSYLVGGRFVTRSISQPQQLPVELGELSWLGGVENGVQQPGVLSHRTP